MGKATRNVAVNNFSTGEMRAWIGTFLDLMEDAGFVQTDDAGQVDVETIELSGAVDATCYAVYRFDDALQSSHPVFFRVDFSISSSTTSNNATSSLKLTVGKGTDGLGVITDVLLPFTQSGVAQLAGSGGSSTLRTHVAISGEGYAGLFGFTAPVFTSGSEYGRGFFLIERSRNASGEATGDGLMVVTCLPAGGTAAVSMNGSSSINTNTNLNEYGVRAINYATGETNLGMSPVITFGNIRGADLSGSSSLAAGSIGPVFPWDMIAPGLAPWRSCVLVSIPAGDMPGEVFETNLCGQVGTFYPIAPSYSHNRWGIAMGANGVSRWFGAGIRWED